jgi:protein-S-isoprenylcysteine O-methyltransferase Ste14
MTSRKRLPNPGVQFPPPILYIAGFGGAWLLDLQHALPVPGVSRRIVEVLGLVVLIAGIVLMISGIAEFRRTMTAIFPNQPASELVTSGPYRFTRNPMYTGFAIVFIGGALVIDSLWPFALLPLVLALVFLLVIRREEAYLADEFGDQYAAYRRRVRRWI